MECTKAYTTAKHAGKAIEVYRKIFLRFDLVPYRCKQCHQWHLKEMKKG